MIGQTIAIFVDAYRELNARKLFWITLSLSLVAVIAFALLGVDDEGLKLIKLQITSSRPLYWYNELFDSLIIGIVLTWVSTILALISTAGIFPEFIASGSIDGFLAKPIGRARLFITKYLAGLLFVILQVSLVVVASFLILGLCADEWKPRLFAAIPIVVCFFSYLFAISVLAGIQLRSMIAAILIAGVCWVFFGLLGHSEPILLTFRDQNQEEAKQARLDADAAMANLQAQQQNPNASAMIPVLKETAEERQRDAQSAEKSAKWWAFFARAEYILKTITPKTTDTIQYLDTYVFPKTEEDFQMAGGSQRPGRDDRRVRETQNAAISATREVISRSPAWSIGTSLIFEVVVIGAAMWVFVRRDY